MLRNSLVNNKAGRGAPRWAASSGLQAAMAGLLAIFTLQHAAAADDPALDVRFDTLLRYEYSDARVPEEEDFLGSRSRLGLHYETGKTFSLFGEVQYALVTGLSDNANAASALYRADTATGTGVTNEALKVSQLWAEVIPVEAATVRLGRQPIEMGSLTSYVEPEWNYLKKGRLSERLVGTTGGTYGVRSYDGISGLFNLGGYDLHLFAAQPTTGVFAIRNGLEQQEDVLVAAADLTLRRGTAAENTEATAFLVGYSDTRNSAAVKGLFGDIRVYTLGGSLLGVYPTRAGRWDALLWGAYQFGTYADDTNNGVRELDHSAWALLAETGYQFASLPMTPWVRTGFNTASGDHNRGDDVHGTFFNVLPSNFFYYGMANQVAFQNLVNWFAQLRVHPAPKLGVQVYVHRFWLAHDTDGRYFGPGAYNRRELGFGVSPSNGSRDVGTEVDVVVTYNIGGHWSLFLGYAYLNGGDVFSGKDTHWASTQVALKY